MHLKQLVLLCIIAAAAASKEKPRFKFSQTNKIMLSWEETWEVGSSNMLAFLNTDKRLIIKVVVEGDFGTGLRKILQFKCSQTDEFRTIDMESLRSDSNEKQCESTIPFSVSLRSAAQGEFEFTLLASNLMYYQAFSNKLELQVSVEHSAGTLVSNSLFVWNLDALSKLNSVPEAGQSYPRRFLTSEAVEFLKRMEIPADQEFNSIKFLDPEITRMIGNAPAFLKAKINIGAILNFDAGTCESFQISRASMFVNYHSKLDERNQNLLKHMYLDVENGLLHYSSYGLSTAISDFFNSKSPSQIGICTTLSFAGHGQPYDKTFSVAQKIPKAELAYTSVGSKSSSCKIVGSMPSKPVTIFSGMDYTTLVCPIICSDPNIPYHFYHGDVKLTPDSRRDWTEMDGVRISKTGNIVEFPPTISHRHSGDYRCQVGSQVFTFNTQAISMPQFVAKAYSGGGSADVSGKLPPTVYAMEGESLAYNCTVYFTNVLTTRVKPVFYTSSSSSSGGGGGIWRKLEISDFNSLVSPDATVVSQSDSGTQESKTLTLTVGSVPAAFASISLNFTHRYACDVSVDAVDTNKVGMPSYSVQSGSNVFYLSRPGLDSFDMAMAKNCSVQKCSAAQGAYFQFALKPELVAYLRAIGVTVTGYFKVDDAYLSDIRVLSRKGVAEIRFDEAAMKLTFKVNPITDADVLRELQSRTMLTPVFNFRYAAGSQLANLRMMKERHGPHDVAAGARDCRVDPLCFYSTDFDAATGLRGLALELEFQGEPVPRSEAATAGTGMIVGILLAAIILLVIAVLLVFLLRRDTGQTYLVDEKERQQGNHPDQEAKEEQFKEYQRPEEAVLQASRLSMNSSISAASRDDQELEQYGNDDIDYTKFVEDGSFIGDYSADARKRDAFNAHQV